MSLLCSSPKVYCVLRAKKAKKNNLNFISARLSWPEQTTSRRYVHRACPRASRLDFDAIELPRMLLSFCWPIGRCKFFSLGWQPTRRRPLISLTDSLQSVVVPLPSLSFRYLTQTRSVGLLQQEMTTRRGNFAELTQFITRSLGQLNLLIYPKQKQLPSLLKLLAFLIYSSRRLSAQRNRNLSARRSCQAQI